VLIPLFSLSLAAASTGITADDCGSTLDINVAELTARDPELYLLQRHAQVIRKSTSSRDNATVAGVKTATVGSLSASGSRAMVAADAVAKTAANRSAGYVSKNSSAHLVQSRTLKIVIPVGPRQPPGPPLTKEQRKQHALHAQDRIRDFWTQFIILVGGAVLVLGAVLTMILNVIENAFARIFGEMIEVGIEAIADEILGLDVSFGSVQVSVLRGSVHITDLKISNPPKWKQKSDCFLHANLIDVRLYLWDYVWSHSFSKVEHIQIDSIVFKDMNLDVEKSMWSSNVHDILAIVKGKTKPKDDGAGKCQVILHKLTIADASATVPFLGRIVVPTIQYKDFDKDTEGKVTTLQPIVVEILKSLCEKVVTLQQK